MIMMIVQDDFKISCSSDIVVSLVELADLTNF